MDFGEKEDGKHLQKFSMFSVIKNALCNPEEYSFLIFPL